VKVKPRALLTLDLVSFTLRPLYSVIYGWIFDLVVLQDTNRTCVICVTMRRKRLRGSRRSVRIFCVPRHPAAEAMNAGDSNPAYKVDCNVKLITHIHTINIDIWGTSVSVVSDYRLDEPGSIPGRRKDFYSSLCVQTSSEAHPASYPMSISTGVKRGRGVTLTTHLHLVPRLRKCRSYSPIPLGACMA
jgi:hypothetical protein